MEAIYRIDGGTALIALRPAMTMTGMVISASVSPPTKGADRGKASQTALNDLAHVMLNLNEFFYIK